MSCRFVNFIGCLGGQELMERKLGETNWEIGTAGWANGWKELQGQWRREQGRPEREVTARCSFGVNSDSHIS